MLLKYGLAGVCLIAMALYILKQDKHKEEQDDRHEKKEKEWRDTMEKVTDKMDNRSEETNKNIRDNTNILAGLKTLLENRK